MSQITKRALEASLKKLLTKKPLDKITITDITEDCGINRMTFYYHFKDIYDLVEWVCVEDATRILGENKTYDTWQEGFLRIFDFTAHRADADKELHINCNDYTEAEILAMPFWERLAQELDELDRQAHEILQKEFPDDEDIPGLALTDITIDKSGCYGTFSLCYDTGDSPAGELYLNVSFDEQFVPSPKVGYDTF